MTKQEVTTHPAFAQLTENYQAFVKELLDNGNDKLAAALATWKCKNDESATTMANRAMKKPHVKLLINLYYGVDPLKIVPTADEVVALAWQAAQKPGTDSNGLAKLLEIVIKVKGYATKPADNPASPQNPEEPAEDDEELMAELESRSRDEIGSTTEVQNRSVLPV